MERLRLFAVYVGGTIKGAHVELHDMRFVAAACIEDAYEDLRSQWWGDARSLHLDAWGAIEWADGYKVTIGAGPCASGKRLFFINLGGYDPAQFTELHENCFIVAEDERAAKAQAMERIRSWTSPHKDFVHAIETVIDVAAAAQSGHIRLDPAPAAEPFRFEARYVPIGRR